MLANRLTYFLDLKGSSMIVDTACSGTLTAMHLAFTAIQANQCNAAIVAGVNLISHPNVTKSFEKLQVLSPDGSCHPFNNDRCGFVRSECIQVMILQRKSDAKRIYAEIVNVDTNSDGFKQNGLTYPSKFRQQDLLENFYQNLNVKPNEVDYIEMHGTGTRVGDPVECWSVNEVFNKNRKGPLMIGSVKSNMGHSEPASACASIAKAIIAFQNNLLPPTLHCTQPDQNIPSLKEGKLKVCSELTPFESEYIAINAFGMGGVNGHLLLKKGSEQQTNIDIKISEMPYLIQWSGRTENSLNKMFDFLKESPMNHEFIGMLHNIQRKAVNGHTYRGYGIYRKDQDMKSICFDENVMKTEDKIRKICWVFAGLGSQWPGMAKDLMKISLFRQTIEKCHDVLLKYNYNLLTVLKSTDPSVVNDILNSIVAITAIGIGLVDILNILNIPVDYIIGHSLGESVAGYADKALTLEQTILCSYFRARSSKNADTIDGRMYAVGMGYNDIKNLLPQGVYCACHNSSTSSTISGPKIQIQQFAEELKSKNVFVKEVNSDNIPFHSPYVHCVADMMYLDLKKTILKPKKRSTKWLSSCYKETDWSKSVAQSASAEYFVQNLSNEVLFEECLQMLPEDLIVVEVAPCGLLQAILKRQLPNDIHVPLLQRNSGDNLVHLMKAFGKYVILRISKEHQLTYICIQFVDCSNTA